MASVTTLHIRRVPGRTAQKIGTSTLGELHGGPDVLLTWLEMQLGLRRSNTPKASRITEYAGALETVADATYSRSLSTDRWATAADLLAKRDELKLAGWNDENTATLPDVVRDLAAVEKSRPLVFPCEADRLRDVEKALNDGQRLPEHQCFLFTPVEQWPVLWQKALNRLAVQPAATTLVHATASTALHVSQTIVCGGEPQRIVQDDSFRYIATRSETSACEFLAATMADTPELLPETVVFCADENLALRLDACLARVGLPTMGIAPKASAHPALQVLPLTLALIWKPVDPATLLDFLMLPVSPLRRSVTRRLIDSLTEQPGLGSERWDEAVKELCDPANDTDGKIRESLDKWLFCERNPKGASVPTKLVRARCNLVAQWAMSRALMMRQNGDNQEEFASALTAAGQYASLLGELAESQGKEISEPQLARLFEEVLADGIQITSLPVAHGGAVHVRSLAEISGPYRRLIWLGLGTRDCAASAWPVADLKRLQEHGIALDDGSSALADLRSAEARGFGFIQESILAILLPRDTEQRWHPLWLAMRRKLENCETPPCLEDMLAAGGTGAIKPFIVQSQEYEIRSPQGEHVHWTVPAGLLQDRESVSASELQDRLGCPVKWMLNYQAKIRPSAIAEIPESFQLKGTFCHSILERLFRDRADLPSADEAVAAVQELFEARIPFDAAPLAQPHQQRERTKLRTELANATRILVNSLAAEGYKIAGIEVGVEGAAFGKPLNGSIDCLAVHPDGHEAVIDFKYAGRTKYRQLLADGRAVQLATYAHARATRPDGDGQYPCVAYLVLAEGQLFTPTGSPLQTGALRQQVDGPAIREVWQQFSTAIETCDGWLSGAEPIPARPLQDPSEWPDGVRLVLDMALAPGKEQEPCRYCPYKQLCGLHQLL